MGFARRCALAVAGRTPLALGRARASGKATMQLAPPRTIQVAPFARCPCAGACTAGLVGLHQHQGPSQRHGGPKKNGPQSIGKSRGGWNTKIHMVAADARTAVTFCLSPGQAHDAPEGRRLLSSLGPTSRPVHLLMDRAYEGNETRQLALDLGFIPVVPPMKTRIEP